jgi:uncharacterized membrane protein YbhN (UPF0104 family)/membrane-associated phospholipid phosphatase
VIAQGPPEHSAIRRHPGDILRVVVGGLIFAITAAIAKTGRVSTFERDIFRLVNHLPSLLEFPVIVVMQAGSLIAIPVSAAAALAARRPRLARDLALAGTAAWLVARAMKAFVSRARPSVVLNDVILRQASDVGLGFPSGHAAVAAALATVAGPFLPRRVRHATWVVVALVGIGRMYTGVHLPLDVIGGATLGWAIGAALHLVLGAPSRGMTVASVRAALAAAGFEPVTVTPFSADARGSAPFRAVTSTGRQLFLKAVNGENRNADFLFKLWRYVALRHLEDETPFVTPKQQIEHEALLLLVAARAGVRVPTAVTFLEVGPRQALLILQDIDGRSLDKVDPSELTNQILCAMWQQVRRLHAARIAHRDLRLANIMIDDEARPWIIDFGFGEVSASDHRLAQDVAELLTSTALVVGSKRAVGVAVEMLGTDAVSRALQLIQPLALSATTRSALQHSGETLTELRRVTAARTGSEAPELERLARIRPITIVWLALGLLTVHLLLLQVGELPRTLDVLRRPQIVWLALALVTAAATTLAAAAAQIGSVVPELALGKTVAFQLATSFADRVTRGRLDGVDASVRYLERSGLSRVDAQAASAANTLVGAIVHVVLLFVACAIVSQSQIDRVHLPDRWIVLVVVVAVFALAGLGLRTSTGRRRLVEPTRQSVRAHADLVHHPRRAVQLYGGSFAGTVLSIATLYCALHAFGEDLEWPKVALAYLGGTLAAAPATTPGGLGAVEAALVAGLTLLGAETAPSIAGVLAFRLATFWLPIAPGWIAFRLLQKRGAI